MTPPLPIPAGSSKSIQGNGAYQLTETTTNILLDKLDEHIMNAPPRLGLPAHSSQDPWTPHKERREAKKLAETKLVTEISAIGTSPDSASSSGSAVSDAGSNLTGSAATDISASTPFSITSIGVNNAMKHGGFPQKSTETPTKGAAGKTFVYHIGGRMTAVDDNKVRPIYTVRATNNAVSNAGNMVRGHLNAAAQYASMYGNGLAGYNGNSNPTYEQLATANIYGSAAAIAAGRAPYIPIPHGEIQPTYGYGPIKFVSTNVSSGTPINAKDLAAMASVTSSPVSGHMTDGSCSPNSSHCQCGEFDFSKVTTLTEYNEYRENIMKHRNCSPSKVSGSVSSNGKGISAKTSIFTPSAVSGDDKAESFYKSMLLPYQAHPNRPGHIFQNVAASANARDISAQRMIQIAANPFFFDAGCDHCPLAGRILRLSPFFNPPTNNHHLTGTQEGIEKALHPKNLCSYHAYSVLTGMNLMKHEVGILDSWTYRGKPLPVVGSVEYSVQIEKRLLSLELLCGSCEDNDSGSDITNDSIGTKAVTGVKEKVAQLDRQVARTVRVAREAAIRQSMGTAVQRRKVPFFGQWA